MSDWTAGYVADIGYTYGYYNELNPLRARWALLHAGIAPPSGLMTQGGTACELGFGQGVSINAHAAGSPMKWWGTDFNPAQAAFARELADASGASVNVSDAAFAEFCSREDLPEFDMIGLHGIWSWISDENRQVIVDFVRRKLKVGGVLYVSYNIQPGWSAVMPLRHLLTEHAHSMGSANQGVAKRIDGAIEFVERLFALNPRYVLSNPMVQERLKRMKDQSRNYLAHEYFNRDWHPMYFADMAKWLGEAKVSYAASAHLLDLIENLNLTPEQRALMADLNDPTFRQTLSDYCTGIQFRRDLWVKGARRMSPLEQTEAMREMRFLLVQPRPLVQLKAQGALGEGDLQAHAYGPVLDFLADHAPKSFMQIEQAVAAKGLTLAQLREVVTVLVGIGALHPVQDDKAASKVRPFTDKLNKHLMTKARASADVGYLVSPMTGGAVPVTRFHQLFLLARVSGRKTAADWAEAVWQLLSVQGQRLILEGKTVESAEDNLSELRKQAQGFSDVQLPVLKALGVA